MQCGVGGANRLVQQRFMEHVRGSAATIRAQSSRRLAPETR